MKHVNSVNSWKCVRCGKHVLTAKCLPKLEKGLRYTSTGKILVEVVGQATERTKPAGKLRLVLHTGKGG